MKPSRLYREQIVERPLAEVFGFFSRPENLARITPPRLGFKILTPPPIEMKPGARIEYHIRVFGIRLHWVTLITEYEPPHRFVDLQEKGPYKLWHHTHTFEPLGKGTLMKDIVQYRVPFGAVGWAASGWLVASDVEKIFGFRRKACAEIFS